MTVPVTAADPAFAHASEAEMARILDFYAVRWLYEPDTFPLVWNLSGAVVESFSPDFYLPELDLYLEITTLKQSLVRKKNRKLRRLRALYPDVRVKLFYARDFRALMLKYGRSALTASLSGTSGQVTPPRTVDPDVGDVADGQVDRTERLPAPPVEPASATDAAAQPVARIRSVTRRARADRQPAPIPNKRAPEASIER